MGNFELHLIAMLSMLIDHIGFTFNIEIFRYIGRISFPIYAFFIAQGFRYTHDFKKYLIRIVIFAFLSEIPFNLFTSQTLLNPVRQNVLWTFAISLIGLYVMKKIQTFPKWSRVILNSIVIFSCCLLATILKTDYFFIGVLEVMVFYFIDKRFVIFILVLALNILNPIQIFATLSLPLIFSYKHGESKHKWLFYWFYPVHLLILSLIKIIL